MITLLIAFIIIAMLLKRPDIIKSVNRCLIICASISAGVVIISVVASIFVVLALR